MALRCLLGFILIMLSYATKAQMPAVPPLSNISSAPDALILDTRHQSPSIDLTPYLELLEDPSRDLGFSEVTQAPPMHAFRPSQGVPDLGHTPSALWVRFRLKTGTGHDYLVVDRPIGGSIELYLSGQDTLFYRLEGQRLPIYHLRLPANQLVTVHVRVTNGYAVLSLPLKLMTADALIRYNSQENLFFTSILIGFGILAVYNLLLFISLREHSHLSLVFFICAAAVVYNKDANLLPFPEFFNNTEHYLYFVPMLVLSAAAFHYWRYINYQGSPIVDIFCQWVMGGSLVLIPVAGLIFYLESIFNSLLLLFIPVLFVFSTIVAWHGHQLTRNAYGAALTIIVSTVPYIAMQAGWVSHMKPPIYIAHAGSLLALLLLSFVQGEQTRWLREQKERSDATSKAKDEFLTTMSHELRTPIHAVTGAADLLQQTPLSDEQRSYVDKLQIASHHMLGLVNDTLDLSQIDRGHLRLGAQHFRLDEELDKLHAIFSLSAKQKGLELSVRYDLPGSVSLYGDAMRLTQVLINLLGNAIKFTERGHITLSVLTEPGSTDTHLHLHFKITDTGIGIGSEQQQRMFQPFSQQDASITRRYGGSGLGLAISYKLVELMGGRLEMDSAVGRGSRFFFTLIFPFQSADSLGIPAPAAVAWHAKVLENMQILLVDDDEINRFMGKRMLEKLGATVMLAEDGNEAYQLVMGQPFHLVLMDVSMPNLDGYETTRKIRTAGHLGLHIVAMTAHTLDETQHRCLTAGMNGYISKPFRTEELLLVVNGNINGGLTSAL